MAEPVRKRATYEDILALPDHVVGEIIGGTLQVMPRPRPRHANVEHRSGESLGGYHGPPGGGGGRRDGPGGWILLVEPEVHIDEDILVPDVAGWKRTTLPAIPDAAYIEVAPDWVMEILSPRTARIDRVEKRALYASWGVEWLWYADPDARTLEVFQLIRGAYTDRGSWGGSAVMHAEPFPLAEVNLGVWWGDE